MCRIKEASSSLGGNVIDHQLLCDGNILEVDVPGFEDLVQALIKYFQTIIFGNYSN